MNYAKCDVRLNELYIMKFVKHQPAIAMFIRSLLMLSSFIVYVDCSQLWVVLCILCKTFSTVQQVKPAVWQNRMGVSIGVSVGICIFMNLNSSNERNNKNENKSLFFMLIILYIYSYNTYKCMAMVKILNERELN